MGMLNQPDPNTVRTKCWDQFSAVLLFFRAALPRGNGSSGIMVSLPLREFLRRVDVHQMPLCR